MPSRRLHRSFPVPVAEDEDTYNVDAVVHSLIAGMEEGDGDDEVLLGDEKEVLFMGSTDPMNIASSGVLADHEDEMLAEVNRNRVFWGNKRGKCPRWDIGNACSVGCVPIVLIVGFIIMVASITISYANMLARTNGQEGPIVQGLHQTVPAPPPDLTVLCSKHFYGEVRCRALST
jgi:hypothetical protein